MDETEHQFVERESGCLRTEEFFGNSVVRFIYSRKRENPSILFKTLTSPRMSKMLSFLNYDCALGAKLTGAWRFCRRLDIDLSECLCHPGEFRTLRNVFERKIRYWETRPMPQDPGAIVSPCDAKMLVGSFSRSSRLYIKDKFFDYVELLAEDKSEWLGRFFRADYAIFRLTPEKYHYNHLPATGMIVDYYGIDGRYDSCNPRTIVAMAKPYSKNRRFVTIIDTDMPGGSRIGLVAMIEIVALMIGDISQCYSEVRYDDPKPLQHGMVVKRGQPKSLFRPGSSTVILLFQEGRILFSPDLTDNLFHREARSWYSDKFGIPLVETEVRVRSEIGRIEPG
jgi:phosphatidylserine decarboxylase